MGKRSGPSMMKRQKEMNRLQKQQDKAERRKAAKEESRARTAGPDEDPDIAGIVPGPQAPPADHDAG